MNTDFYGRIFTCCGAVVADGYTSYTCIYTGATRVMLLTVMLTCVLDSLIVRIVERQVIDCHCLFRTF